MSEMQFISRRAFLGAAAAPMAAAAFAARSGYNVLFFAVDDLRPELGCYGNRLVRSPHIDEMASRGLVFRRAYCQQAVCSPSRTSLLTGLRPDSTRVYELQTHFRKFLPDTPALPQQFRNNGYATTGFGKIYHGGLDDARSWSIASWRPGNGPAWGTPENEQAARRAEERLREKGWYNPRTATKPGSRGPAWEAPDVADNQLPDGQIADAAIGAMRKMQKERFFLAVGFLKPHLPFVAPKRYHDLYAKTSFPLPPNPYPPQGAPGVALTSWGELRSYRGIPAEGPLDEEKTLALIRSYYAAISYTDAQVGRVMAELKRLGLDRNTVVILWGDHGWQLGEHGLWCKHTNFELATRAPLIISVPGQNNAGASTDALTEFVDIYPSLCELCGVPKPSHLEGWSFAPLLDDPKRPWKKAAFSQYPRSVKGEGPVMGYSMRTDRYRYTEWRFQKPDKGVHAVELYDHQKDPAENVNIAMEPANAELLRQLAAQLKAGWRAALPAA